MIGAFSVDKRDIYINSHYQHFKKTVDDMKFRAQSTKVITETYRNVKEAIDKKRDDISEQEDLLLQTIYGETGFLAKYRFKSDMRVSLGKDPFVQSYLETREDTLSIDDALKRGFDVAEKAINKQKGSNKQSAKTQYIQEKLKGYKDMFKMISEYLDTLFKIIEKFPESNPSKHKNFLKTMRGKAKAISESANKNYVKKAPNSFRDMLKLMRDIEDGKVDTLAKASTDLVSKMFRAVNETMYELVVLAASMEALFKTENVTVEMIGEALKNGKVTWVGPAGMSAKNKDSLGTTDLIFNFGDIKIGFDVKASREVYSKSTNKSGYVFNTIKNALSEQMPRGIVKGGSSIGGDYIEKFAYVLTTMLTMSAIKKSGIEVPNAAPINSAEMYSEMYLPIQRVALVTAAAHFIDEYLYLFKTDLRSQIVILMGDNVMFLTEFIDHVASKIYSVMTGGNYDNIGFVDFPSIQAQVDKEYSKGFLPKGLVKKMVDDKVDLQRSLFSPGGGADSGTIYPRLFSQLTPQMNAITNKVLGKRWMLRFQFKFNLTNNNTGSRGGV